MVQEAFLNHLRQSRLLTDGQVGEIAGRCACGDAPHALLEELVASGVLTPFQAERIRSGAAAGLVLGQYRLLDELGKGGFGRVYRALHTMMDRVVALKVIAREMVENERVRTWFKREVLAITRLAHPNVVIAHDASDSDDALFLVMEHVDGPNLDKLVRSKGPLSIGLACEVVRQTALALQYAHDQGMVHRDIKPANLLIQRAALEALPLGGPTAPNAPPLVKVADFGLARLHATAWGGGATLQHEKGFLGTPDYVSPEQADNVHGVDIRSDLYSLGCTFFFALTGRPPFRGKTPLETVVKHMREEPVPPEDLRPETPPAVSAIVLRLLEKDPAQRFQTPAELITELEILCGQEALRPHAAPTPRRVPLSGVRRRAAVEASAEAAPVLAATARIPHLTPEAAAHETSADPSPAAVSAPAQAPVQPVPAPLPAAELARQDAQLRQAWQRWTAVIAAIDRMRDHTRVSERDYRRLHGNLLALCRTRIDQADGARFRLLEGIVEPWLTPRTLAAADRETLGSLLRRCREVEQGLGGGRGLGVFLGAAVLWCVAVAAGLAWQVYALQREAPPARTGFARLWQVFERHPLLWAALGVSVVVALALALLGRRRRI